MKQNIMTFNQYLRKRFGERVQRISLDGGFTCPNRDGTKGYGGCVFCDNRTFNPWVGSNMSIRHQIEAGIRRARKRYKAHRFLAYFQTFSSTYAPVEHLGILYEKALSHPAIAGLMVSTRPDCLPDEVISLFKRISETYLVWVEIGVQSAHDRTLNRINRCHTWSDSEIAIQKLHNAGIPVAAHVILGLPGESREDMLVTADKLASLRIDGIKLHHLYAVKNTPLEKMFRRNEWIPMTEENYIETAAAFLRRFEYDLVVMRFSGDCPEDVLVAPLWKMGKHEIREAILKRLEESSV